MDVRRLPESALDRVLSWKNLDCLDSCEPFDFWNGDASVCKSRRFELFRHMLRDKLQL